MKSRMHQTLALYATASGTHTGGSSLINKPGAVVDTPAVRDIARHRLVKTNPDIDAQQTTNDTGQTDSAAFTGKKYTIQDTKYGHFTSEHDSSSSASLAEQARPYSRILTKLPEQFEESNRLKTIKRSLEVNPDIS